MSENSDREQWAQVPDTGGMLWASDAGQIATLKYDGAGFNILIPRTDMYGERYVLFDAEGKKSKAKRFVGAMVLVAFGHPRPGSRRVGYRDNDQTNCRLDNLGWMRRGESRVVDLTKRKCLGRGCGVMFMSEGSHNRLCPSCGKRAADSTSNIFEDTESGELPDEPILGGGHHR